MDSNLAAPPHHDERDLEREILGAILEQGRQTFALLKALVDLLVPKGEPDGPKLEELLARITAQQSQIIALIKLAQADLDRLGKALPAAVADAVEERRAVAS